MEDENASRCKDLSKNARRGVQTAPEHERVFGVQEPIWHFQSVERHSKRAEFFPFGLWPNSLWVTIRHTLFDLFAKGCVQIHIQIIHAYFLESSELYKQRMNLIIQHIFLRSERQAFFTLKPHIFSDPLSECCYKIRVFRFQRELNKFL